MLPIRNIPYLWPMCCRFWEKWKNSPKPCLGCSTPLLKLLAQRLVLYFVFFSGKTIEYRPVNHTRYGNNWYVSFTKLLTHWSSHDPDITWCAIFYIRSKFIFLFDHCMWDFCLHSSCVQLISFTQDEFAICYVVCHGNVNSIQNPSTVTNPTMGPYWILLPLTLPCQTTWQIASSVILCKTYILSGSIIFVLLLFLSAYFVESHRCVYTKAKP